jgi:LmbE family N-acetylglucosaminyl deacetylase
MRFHKHTARVFIPDRVSETEAISRSTHIGVGAHPDDLEIMAIDGILACFKRENFWFSGVVVTNGAGSPRAHHYKDVTDEEMQQIRAEEQIKAAIIGEYSSQMLLDYTSSEVKDHSNEPPLRDLISIFSLTKPEVVYTHNLADKHSTHVATALRTIEALRSVPEIHRPKKLLGCEVWRDLDWMLDEDKVFMDCSRLQNLQEALLGVFDSQISGGKRYDIATICRRRVNATYLDSHRVDETTNLMFGMDLTPLIQDTALDVAEYVLNFVTRFSNDVRRLIAELS